MVLCFSAGVGRTGAFIAIDYLIEQAKAEGGIDVFQCVKKLREQRTIMVQTLVSYPFKPELPSSSYLLQTLYLQWIKMTWSGWQITKYDTPFGFSWKSLQKQTALNNEVSLKAIQPDNYFDLSKAFDLVNHTLL